MNVETTTQSELDAKTIEIDASEGARMLRAVDDFLGRFVACPSQHARTAHALWIVHAYMMGRWDSTPRLAFLSPEPASGKSRALEVTELLVPMPVMAVNVTPAYLFRKVGSEEGPPTILYDEIDTVFGPKAKENEELRALINAGHRRGAVAGRCIIRGKTVVTEEIPAYAAVALAGLGWLPDTIMTRSVIIRMRRRAPNEHVEPFRRRLHLPEGDRVREQIDLWTRAQPTEITHWPELPLEIKDRDADVWEPLLVVADFVGGEWPQRARAAAVALVAAAKEVEPSLGIRLLADSRAVFGDEKQMPSKMLVEKLIGLEEAPWRDLRGKRLDERWLAKRLREYGIKSKNLSIGNTRPKGYTREDFLEAWSRYLPPLTVKSATCAPPATSSASQGDRLLHDVGGSGSDVADSGSVAARNGQRNTAKTSAGAHVAHVAVIRSPGGEDRTCAQCGANDGQTNLHQARGQSVWLHRECVRFWVAHQQWLGRGDDGRRERDGPTAHLSFDGE